MTPEERKSLAEQLLANPLFADLFDRQEKSAIEAMIYEGNDEQRARAAMRVQAIRSLRQDCEASLRSDHGGKAAPA